MKILKQISLLLGICLLGQGIADLIPIPFPGSVISMIIMFLFYISGVVKPHMLEDINAFLLDNMAFFFIPSGVGIITKFEVLKNSVVQIFLICIISTIVTFAVTAYTVKFVMYLCDRIGKKERKCKNGI